MSIVYEYLTSDPLPTNMNVFRDMIAEQNLDHLMPAIGKLRRVQFSGGWRFTFEPLNGVVTDLSKIATADIKWQTVDEKVRIGVPRNFLVADAQYATADSAHKMNITQGPYIWEIPAYPVDLGRSLQYIGDKLQIADNRANCPEIQKVYNKYYAIYAEIVPFLQVVTEHAASDDAFSKPEYINALAAIDDKVTMVAGDELQMLKDAMTLLSSRYLLSVYEMGMLNCLDIRFANMVIFYSVFDFGSIYVEAQTKKKTMEDTVGATSNL